MATLSSSLLFHEFNSACAHSPLTNHPTFTSSSCRPLFVDPYRINLCSILRYRISALSKARASKPSNMHTTSIRKEFRSYESAPLSSTPSANIFISYNTQSLFDESSQALGPRVATGLGLVVGTMIVTPDFASAAEVASNLDAWTSLVAAEPKNALSLPTWIIHVASVVECLSLPCRMTLMSLDFVFDSHEIQSSFLEMELENSLSLLTWFIHVASVVEWVTAMGLVWRYGDTPGNAAWKGLSWGMVPLLGGAMCACTWHFFYNAQSLEILVVFQAALTVIGNCTMWAAAFRIFQSSQERSKAP